MSKFILYLPYSEFIDAYGHKALGAIPLGFKDTGYDSQLIVGIMKSEKYRATGIKVYETGNLDTEYVNDYSEMHLIKRIKNFINIRELIPVLKILIREKPDIFMAYNNSTLTGVIVFLYKVYCKIFRVNTRLILKLDNDGSSILSMPETRKKLIYSYYKYLSFIFERILTETTCGYDAFKDMPGLKNRLRVVPNSVSNEFLEKYLPVNRQKNVITVSRVTPDKGLNVLIKSFHIISSIYPEWNLEIIGEITDNEEYNKLLNS
jgi:glycosyltransferase involved in cell wall biosynthesis